jgi:uncharacterized membrane protein
LEVSSLADSQFPRWPLYASISLGALYIIAGTLYIFSGLGFIIALPSSSDIISSFMLLIVGTVYIVGIKYLKEQKREGYAFTIVATALATVLFFLHVIVFGTNALGSFLGLEDWVDWTPFDNLSPGILLYGIIALSMAFLKLTGRLGGEKGIFPLEE